MRPLFFILALFLAANHSDAQWQAVEEDLGKGAPKSALEKIAEIEKAAAADKAFPELARAIARRCFTEGQIEGAKAEESIRRLEASLEKAPPEIQPVLTAILASWYWDFFRQNQWQYMQRTQTASEPGADIQTWDLKRIIGHTDGLFQKALANPAELKAISIESYADLINSGDDLTRKLRPTLLDFIGHQALDFYQFSRQVGVRAEHEFTFDAQSPAFADRVDFLAWTPEVTDESQLEYRALRLWQLLTRDHNADADALPAAMLDVERIDWARETASSDEETNNKAALGAYQRIAEKAPDTPPAAYALFQAATILNEQDKAVDARKLAAVGAKDPSAFGAMCRNLIKQIEQKELRVETEAVWNDPAAEIVVTHRNTDHVWFRLYKLEWDVSNQQWQSPWQPRQLQKRLTEWMKDQEAVRVWDAPLPEEKDFRQQSTSLPAPTDLPDGYYVMITSGDAGFSSNAALSATTLWVSPLALVASPAEGSINGFVLDAKSGEPVPGATVTAYYRDKNGKWKAGDSAETDADGFYSVSKTDQTALLGVKKGETALWSGDQNFYSRDNEPEKFQTAFLFTDRAIYRPGQSIFYKGILVSADPAQTDPEKFKDAYKVVPNQEVTVTFTDPNGKEIAKQTKTTNAYGSVEGAFTAPKDRLMGAMSIQVDDLGETSVRVEEYKRPKFYVEIDPPKDAAKLGDKITLTGRATGYNGAPVDGAKVVWRVDRSVQWPGWYRYCGYLSWWNPGNSGDKQLAHETAVTKADGTFEITFTAEPDATVAEKAEPTFVYTVNADVTDTAGETRSGDQSVSVAYTALKADMSAPDWQTTSQPTEIAVTTTTINGEPLAAKGSIAIHRLQEPDSIVRAALSNNQGWNRGQKVEKDMADPNNWPLGDVVQTNDFVTNEKGKGTTQVKLAAGVYRAVLSSKDAFGKDITAILPIQVLDPEAKKWPVKVPSFVSVENATLEPGGEAVLVWGTGYETGRACVEIEHRGKTLKRFWTDAGSTQQAVRIPVTEAYRGGFTVRITQVRENRAYPHSQRIAVPWSQKNLILKWEHMRNKLEPGAKETWSLIITGADGKPAPAELVATLYDASLDAFAPHEWTGGFDVFYQDYGYRHTFFCNQMFPPFRNDGYWRMESEAISLTWPHYRDAIGQNYGRGMPKRRSMMAMGTPAEAASDAMPAPLAAPAAGEAAAFPVTPATPGYITGGLRSASAPLLRDSIDSLILHPDAQPNGQPLDPAAVKARANLNETAFFYPQLTAGDNGEVKITFTMPEALTKWKFLGFAHDKELRAGLLTGETVTAKDLMAQPNPPRFLREGDMVEFTVKITNQSDAPQSGKALLDFKDAATLQDANASLGNKPEQPFEIPAKESRTLSWKIKVPDGQGFLTYKAVAATDKLSDGEEGFLPVLSRRILVTESLPLPIRNAGEKEFTFAKLIDSAKSDTLQSQSLTVQMTSQPAWYAVMALPYLMEYQHECAEQTFNRFYANVLAQHIANSDPKIRRVFDLWKETPSTLDSPLLKNQDLKGLLIEETPWLRDANNETEARHNIGLLFDENRLANESERVMQKLADMQLDNGGFPWFPGGRDNEFITLYILTGFGRLQHLGVNVDDSLALSTLDYLDNWINRRHQEILRDGHPELNHYSGDIALYLYGRSFFLKKRPVQAENRAAIDYFLGQAKKYWLDGHSRMSQAHTALGLLRFGDKETPAAIVKSLREFSVSNDELGMFWRDQEGAGWHWWQAPIETQAMMIEAFREVADDAKAVDDCQVWLLKQKQTQSWPTTKSTADAVYALLLGGSNKLASDAVVSVSLGGQEIKPPKIEAGTGFYEEKFGPGEIKPDMGKIKLVKTDEGVSWGSVSWQYLEDMSKVTPHDGTPLKLKKTLFLKKNTPAGPTLEEIKGPLHPGDELVVRLELRSDRDMEFLHLKDQRGSGTEPVNVLSGYRWQDALGYYESTRDTASHFFIDSLRKGVYVFEYSVRVQLRGAYQSGIAEIQCMYAPEFNSHSESFTLKVE